MLCIAHVPFLFFIFLSSSLDLEGLLFSFTMPQAFFHSTAEGFPFFLLYSNAV